MPKGIIRRLMYRGYGFIKGEGEEEDLLFHRNDLQGVEFNTLREGQKVEFLLYKQGQDEIYQTLHLWVDITELR